MEQITDLSRVSDYPGLRHLFIVVNEWSISGSLREALNQFRAALPPGNENRLIRTEADLEISRHVRIEISQKNWPEEITDALYREHEPYMVIMGENLRAFDPQQHDWAVIWRLDYTASIQEFLPEITSCLHSHHPDAPLFELLRERFDRPNQVVPLGTLSVKGKRFVPQRRGAGRPPIFDADLANQLPLWREEFNANPPGSESWTDRVVRNVRASRPGETHQRKEIVAALRRLEKEQRLARR